MLQDTEIEQNIIFYWTVTAILWNLFYSETFIDFT